MLKKSARPTAHIEEIFAPPDTGLTSAQIERLQAAGLTNRVELQSSRTYSQILRENVFSLINGVFFVIAMVLIFLNRTSDAITVTLIIVGGSSVNLFQELRAKWKLDQIALLTRPKITVIRNGQRQHIAPDEIVLGDILWVEAGDQIVVDGIMVASKMDVDEALLTGESDLIAKRVGDEVHSGSFCVTGSAAFRATKVGENTLAYQLTTGARAFRRVYTPLQNEINIVIQVLLLVAIFFWILYGVSYLIGVVGLEEGVQIAAVVAGLVPAGLYLAITLAYALGAVRLASENAVIQQANAIESLSNVDVLCLDKTGTLTTNRIEFKDLFPVNGSQPQVEAALADFVTSISSSNRTTKAIRGRYTGTTRPLLAEVPFSSVLKWSAVALDTGVFVLGAPEMLAGALQLGDEQSQLIGQKTALGLRVLLFAQADPGSKILDPAEKPCLPERLELLAVLTFSEELRPNVQETLAGFARAGVTIKVISGDNPDTVAVLARQAGLGEGINVISGLDLAQMDDTQFAAAAQDCTIFGRVTPEQKSRLVQSLKAAGSYVAMTGDGVNDVLSLKQANLSIAMEGGSQITRSVADIILLKDSFSALPHAFLEGQRIRNGVHDVMNLFLVRIFTFVLLIFAIELVTGTFPLLIRHNAIVTTLVVGIPTIGVAFWAQPGQPPRRSMVRSTLHFVLPATLTLAITGLFVYLAYLVIVILVAPIPDEFVSRDMLEDLLVVPRSALVTILIYCGLLLIPFLKPPSGFWEGGAPRSGDWRYTLTALAMLLLYFVIVLIPPLRQIVDLAWLGISGYVMLGGVALGWGLLLRTMWRQHLLDRFLGVDLG